MTVGNAPTARRSLHPLLFALYPVLLLWGLNATTVHWREGLLLCAIAAVIAVVAQAACTALLRDRLMGATLASMVIAVVFSYGRIYTAIVGVTVGGHLIGRHRYLAIAVTILVVLVARLLRRSSPAWLARATGALQVAAMVLVILAVVPLFGQVTPGAGRVSPADPEEETAIVTARNRPDIYYIITDGYAAGSTLESQYAFSNAPFLQALKERGFYVADSANANYVTTVLSLTSSLNMEYLGAHRPRFSPATPLMPDDGRIFNSLAVVRYLRQRGYVVVNVKPTYQFAGRFHWSLEWNSLSSELLRSSVLTGLTSLAVQRDVRLRHRSMVEALLAAQGARSPKFVFAHLMVPHPPFVFTATGELNRQADDSWSDKAGYVGQVQYVNTLLLGIVDSLRRAAAREPIIIIQADHGPASEGGSWMPPSPALVRERLPILNAYRVPGRSCPFYQRVTPVNSFRILFNCVFGASFALQPDSSFFSSYENMYELLNVTATFTEPPR